MCVEVVYKQHAIDYTILAPHTNRAQNEYHTPLFVAVGPKY